MEEIYRHYKSGNFYVVTGRCTNESDLVKMVLYSEVGKSSEVWCRPEHNFFGEVTSLYNTEEKVKRFQKYVPEKN